MCRQRDGFARAFARRVGDGEEGDALLIERDEDGRLALIMPDEAKAAGARIVATGRMCLSVLPSSRRRVWWAKMPSTLPSSYVNACSWILAGSI